MKYTTYNPTTGEIIANLEINNDQAFQDNLSDKSWIDGNYSSLNFYVDLSSKIAIQKPPQPGVNHYWDFNSKSWVLDLDEEIKLQRQQRDQLLSIVDRVNPVWYSSLTTEQQSELQQYRQALLDVPGQSNFPLTIEWPTKPAWL